MSDHPLQRDADALWTSPAIDPILGEGSSAFPPVESRTASRERMRYERYLRRRRQLIALIILALLAIVVLAVLLVLRVLA